MRAPVTWDPEPELQTYVRLTDADSFGHLSAARYLDYFIDARDQHMERAYGVDLLRHKDERGESWLVQENRIAYLHQARVKEKLLLRSRLIGFGERETFVESLMLDGGARHLYSLAWTRFAYTNVTNGRRAA